jgi:hypothetical protein
MLSLLPNKEPNDCYIILKFHLDEQEHNYLFINNIKLSDYYKIKYYLILLSSVGIDEFDNLAIIDNNKIVSIALFYWFNIIRKKINIDKMQDFIVDKKITKIKLTNILIYNKDECIDTIEADNVS